MIEVIFYEDSKGFLTGFLIKGHSEYAEKGKDIICAGVSSIAQAIVLGLEEVARVKVELEKSEGKLTCHVAGDYESNVPQALLKTLQLALDDLKESYPDYIRISSETVRGGVKDEN